jgi:hypothetical protein
MRPKAMIVARAKTVCNTYDMPVVHAPIAYAARTGFRQRYYANDHARDTVVVDAQPMAIADARGLSTSLDGHGFVLVDHASSVADFTDRAEVGAKHAREIVALIEAQTGADAVIVTAPGILRFSERSGKAGTLDNSMPARFAHVDVSAETAMQLTARGAPQGRAISRSAQYNIWRSFSGAPQDVPLALCDAGSVAGEDLLSADAIFDAPGQAEWGFESWLIAHNPQHRWHWFSNMTRDEAIIFKTSDSAFGNAVPHVAFDNPDAPSDCAPRASIEMRATAYWFG